MADEPISTTLNLGLGQWAEGANPGFAALNENWALIDAAMLTQGSENPETYPPGGLFLNTEDLAIYRNDGTEESPVWVNILPVGEIQEGAVLKDGSVPMEADLDLGGNKIVGLAAGVDPTDGVNKGQLASAISGILGSISGTYRYVLARNTGDLTDPSPVLFEADENDETTTDETLHDESEPSEFVAPQDGFYMLVFRGRVTDGGGGSVKWLINGVEAPACVFPLVLHDVGENEVFLQDVMMVALDEGDVVTLGVYGLISEPLTIKADSTVAMFLLAANGAGTGDLKADGSVPMTDPFDNGGQPSTNAGDASDPTDLVTLQQMEAADQALQDQIDDLEAPDVGELQAPEVQVTSGNFSFGTTWSEFTASRLDFTLAGSKRVVMEAEGVATYDQLKRADAQIGIRVQSMVAGNPSGDPVDHYGTSIGLGPFGYYMEGMIRCTKRATLAAGDWRISIICRRRALNNSASLYATSDLPARIGLTYLG